MTIAIVIIGILAFTVLMFRIAYKIVLSIVEPPDSNAALRRWLLKNPGKEISEYPYYDCY